ncbi:MAG: DUF2851 family protein [Candidatus Marinimicrobia bacterium]|nr:DUF2851 family protein [Candidatus Neomarinimicrobiota bacterium]MCF7840674.1 DUF2851 family protein [Candidatus Neomarinimicrobiota bacterium]MCF7903341.1 DUF2851 family protein [Candidatus Neomarinimicrobiota bacterium]
MTFRVQDSMENRLLNWWFQVAPDRSGLKTRRGEQLIVLETGVRNDGPGPDIRDAVIALDGRILSGTVEMHAVPQDWYAHSHDEDVAYDNVILHVVSRSGGGPDLPTLVVSDAGAVGWCGARRTLEARELYMAAADRYRYKQEKVLNWETSTTSDWPVIRLGLLDCQAYGPSREKLWWYIYQQLELPRNPTGTAWQGSFQSRNHPHQQRQQIDRVIQNLPAMVFPDLSRMGWQKWEAWWKPHFRTWQIPGTLLREWLINWVVPATYSDIITGLKIWQELSPARHYGLERKVARFTNWGPVQTVLEQQGLLFWWQNGCTPRRCHICPLTRVSVSEKLSNTLYDKRLANSSLVKYERIA